MEPFMWGAGKSAAQSILDHLTDDEVVQNFIHSAPHRKIIFLDEIKRREIKMFVIDLECTYMEDEIKRRMELCSDLVDDSISADYSYIEAYFQKEAVVLDSRLFHRKSNAHLLKKKEPKFYQTLNKNRKGFG